MKYFNIREFEVSDTAKANNIDNSIPAEYVPNVLELVNTILDPLREAWGSGIRVTSGYRCDKLNKVLKGSSTSAHCKALAADIVPVNGDIDKFKSFVLSWIKDKQFDQYIDENDGKASWVHIGLKNNQGLQRKQFLRYKNKQYSTIKYIP